MDSPTNTPLTERVANSIKLLSSAAQDLNTVSGDLGKAIAAIDTVLQSLNIGVPTWTHIQGGNADNFYWHSDIGYAKVSNRWGIALRDVSGSYDQPDEESYDAWLFNDAPRSLRIEGAEKIADLLDALVKNTRETTEKIKAKTSQVNELATTIAAAVGAAKKEAKRITSGLPPPPPPATVAGPFEYAPVNPPGVVLISSLESPLFVSPSIVNPKPHVFTGGAKKPKGGK